MANPPFIKFEYDIVIWQICEDVQNEKTEPLCVELFVKMLKTGGAMRLIVSGWGAVGIFNGGGIGPALVENQRLRQSFPVPTSINQAPGVSTGILIFTKTGYGGMVVV
ncbi:MAG: hypothetical protein ACLTW9_16355 [Enterocloster sp.]